MTCEREHSTGDFYFAARPEVEPDRVYEHETRDARRPSHCERLADTAADVVSLHCPGGAETHHLLDSRRLALLKPSALLINTARGSVIDEAALAAALRAGRIAGAGLDVYEREPQITAELLDLENVVLLPHLGSATVETRTAMGMRAAANLDAFFDGLAPPDLVP